MVLALVDVEATFYFPPESYWALNHTALAFEG